MTAQDFIDRFAFYGLHRFFSGEERDQIVKALSRPRLESVPPEETTINLLVELENLFDAFADRVDKCESRIECRDVCHDFMGRLGAIKARGMREPQRSEEPNG